jgi:two-component system LytT family response regulator
VTLRALVVDDEPRARARLRRLLEPHSDVVVIGEAQTGAEAVAKTLELRPDIVFLDVNMPELSGTDAAARLRDYLPQSVRPAVVFTTAHAEHAVEAFALESVDYLLKPVERDRLAETLRRVRQAHWARTGAAPTAAPLATATESAAYLTVHHGRAIESIAVGALLFVQVDAGTAFAHTVDGETSRLSGGLADIEAELPSPPFVRVSRSAMVNVERALRLWPSGSSVEVELEGGHRVQVSRRRVKRLEGLMGLS